MLNIGVIGFGKRMKSVVGALVKTQKVSLRAVTDVAPELCRTQIIEPMGLEGVHYYTDPDEMLTKEKLDGVLIGTRCNLHTPIALQIAKYGLPIFLEKPVAITNEQLDALSSLLPMNDKIVVSFPLRYVPLVTYMRSLVESGALGTLSQVQAYNNVPYGNGYYHNWYRDDSITGGLFLQKATHDLDYILYMLGDLRPTCICAMASKQVFRGNHKAGLTCANCPDTATCPESPQNLAKKGTTKIREPFMCCFAEDTGNQDSGSILMAMENGLHVTYTQNFVAKYEAGKRGARIIGYDATVEFDFYKNQVVLFPHNASKIETHVFKDSGAHFGGDAVLVDNFIAVMEGTDVSHATLAEGIMSAKLCLAARTSAIEHRFVNID